MTELVIQAEVDLNNFRRYSFAVMLCTPGTRTEFVPLSKPRPAVFANPLDVERVFGRN